MLAQINDLLEKVTNIDPFPLCHYPNIHQTALIYRITDN